MAEGYIFYEQVTDEKKISELKALYTTRGDTEDGKLVESSVLSEHYEKKMSLTNKRKWMNVTYQDRASGNKIIILNQQGTQCGHWTHLTGSKNQDAWPIEKQPKVGDIVRVKQEGS